MDVGFDIGVMIEEVCIVIVFDDMIVMLYDCFVVDGVWLIVDVFVWFECDGMLLVML